MLLATAASTVAPFPADRVATQRLLNDLALDMSRSDADLTNAVRSGNRVGSGWDTWFRKTANGLLDARDAFTQLRPQDQDIIARLRNGAVDLAESAGQLRSAYTSGNTFGSGWDTTLDSKIALVREAAERLYDTGPIPAPPVPPTTPPHGPGVSNVISDAAAAAKLVRQSLSVIRGLPASDRGDASTKDARLAAYNLNMDAQKLIEQHFSTGDAFVTSELRKADAHLEDANWQLAKKPSPDGRFNGVDVPGAQRDTDAAAVALEQLVSALSSGA